MKEIGGYLELEENNNSEYYPELIALNTGRNALLYILKAKKIKKIYLPFFLCDSVSAMCDNNGFQYEYYHIGRDFLPLFEKKLSDDEYIYLVNYYGRLSNTIIEKYKAIYKNVIVDNVQAFFQTPVNGIDTIYSCRKFFGVPDGAYLSTDTILQEEIKTDISKDRMLHILGRYECSASEYYSSFKANDMSFRQLGLMKMSRLTHNLLKAVDYEQAQKKRNANYCLLDKMIGKFNKLERKIVEGAYAYPFYCSNGSSVRKQLADKKIYVATLWPNVLKLESGCERDYAENILPLPVDQRYSEEDMQYVAETVKQILTVKTPC